MSGVLNPRSRDELSRARVALIDKITEIANDGAWPGDMVLVASVLAGLREGTEAGDRQATVLARRMPGGNLDVAEWIALLRRAEAMDTALAITTETTEDGTVTSVSVAVTNLGAGMDGMHRVMAFTGEWGRA